MRARGVALSGLLLAWLVMFAASSALPVRAALVWTVAASPLTLTSNVATNVTLTVSPGPKDIECVTVSIPSGFTVVSASVTSARGGHWMAVTSGSNPTLVTFWTKNGGDRLTGSDQARFVVRTTASSTILGAWTPAAYHNSAPCINAVGPPLVPLVPFVITAGPSPTPTPTPTPTSPPAPTPTATPHRPTADADSRDRPRPRDRPRRRLPGRPRPRDRPRRRLPGRHQPRPDLSGLQRHRPRHRRSSCPPARRHRHRPPRAWLRARVPASFPTRLAHHHPGPAVSRTGDNSSASLPQSSGRVSDRSAALGR